MKNLGVFMPSVVDLAELERLGLSLGGIAISEKAMRFGNHPNEAYLDLNTELSNGCFDEEEFRALINDLGFTPESYVSVHMNYSREAYLLALKIAKSIKSRWDGEVDFSGAGGKLGAEYKAAIQSVPPS